MEENMKTKKIIMALGTLSFGIAIGLTFQIPAGNYLSNDKIAIIFNLTGIAALITSFYYDEIIGMIRFKTCPNCKGKLIRDTSISGGTLESIRYFICTKCGGRYALVNKDEYKALSINTENAVALNK